MASKITVECPGCAAKLNLSDSSKLGKKIKCPKCQEIFLPEPQDDEDIDEDDEPKKASSRKKPAAGAKGSSKKSAKGGSSGGGSNAPLIIGGVVGLLVLVGAGLFFSGIFASKPVAVVPVQPVAIAPAPVVAAPVVLTPAEKMLGLRWMPADTDLIIHAKLAEIWQAPLLKGPLNDPSLAMSLQAFQQAIGVLPADVESITVGIVGFTGTGIRAIANTPSSSPSFGAGQVPAVAPDEIHYVVVLRSKKPLDFEMLAKGVPNATSLEKNGKKYFSVAAIPTVAPANGGWCPEPNTLILASTAELFATMERGETVIPRKELAAIDHTPHLVFASIVRDLKPEEIQLLESKQKVLPEPIGAALRANKQLALQLAGIGLSVKGGFDLQVFTSCGTADGANMLKAQFDGFLNLAKSGFDAYKKTAPPLIAELGEMLLTNLKIEDKNQAVKLSTSIPDSAQAKLEQLPTIVMMMAMTGGFNGLGGPPAATAANASIGDPGMNNPSAAPIPTKQPGETESVDPAKVEGLPDGLKLSAKTAWSRPVSADGAAANSLEILIDVTGDGLETICGSAGISPKTMTLEGGGSLKKVKRTGSGDPQKAFVLFEASDETTFDHPPKTLRVRFVAEAPTASATTIDVLEGSFKFLNSTGTEELTLEEVPKKVKRPLTDPKFKAAEIKLRRGPLVNGSESLTLSSGKDHFLGRVKGSPGDIVSVTEIDKDQSVQRLHSNHEGGKFPEDFQITLTIHANVKEQTVTFRFENVPLPTSDSKPQMQ